MNINAEMNKINLSKIRDRIVQTKIRTEEIAYKEGKEAGKDWASKSASYVELERLTKLGKVESMFDVVYAITDGEFEVPEYIGLNDSVTEMPGYEMFAIGFLRGAIELYRDAMACSLITSEADQMDNFSEINMANRQARLDELYSIKSKALSCGDIRRSDLISALTLIEESILDLWGKFGVSEVMIDGSISEGTLSLTPTLVA